MCTLGNSSFWHQHLWWQKEEVVGFFLDLNGGVVTGQEPAPSREKCKRSKALPIPRGTAKDRCSWDTVS